jgi:hypothetical protein
MKKIILAVITLFFVNIASAQPTATYIDDAPYNYEEVEVRPQFPGGHESLMGYIGKNFKISDYEGSGGLLKVAFVIEVDGTISNVKVVKDLGDGTGAEAKRVIASSPKWSSGENRGKKVRVLYELPIKIAGH